MCITSDSHKTTSVLFYGYHTNKRHKEYNFITTLGKLTQIATLGFVTIFADLQADMVTVDLSEIKNNLAGNQDLHVRLSASYGPALTVFSRSEPTLKDLESLKVDIDNEEALKYQDGLVSFAVNVQRSLDKPMTHSSDTYTTLHLVDINNFQAHDEKMHARFLKSFSVINDGEEMMPHYKAINVRYE